MQILVADDDVVVLAALERQLRIWGYEPVLARSGVEAWRVLRDERPPPIALLAWDLSGLSAFEVCRMLRASPHGASVYTLVTAPRGERIDWIEGREAGVDDFCAEPVAARELHFRIARGVAFREGKPRARMSSIPPSAAGSTPPPPSASGAITLAGRYRLERKIAEGRTADVWLGVHLSLGMNVAIKFMKPAAAENLDYAAFEGEARAIEQLRSEHVARVYGHGSYEGTPYLAMEYLGGETLARRIAKSGPLPIESVVSLVEQIAEGLSDAHARGLVHRDVRPENVVLVDDPDRPRGFTAKLVDFTHIRASLTQQPDDPLAIVTPSFASPEVLKEEVPPSPTLDHWALAATAFVAATGARPFAGDTLGQVFARVCVDPIPVPSQLNPAVPPWFDVWFAAACARDQKARTKPGDLAPSLRRARASSLAPAAEPISSRRPSFAATAPLT